MLDFSIELNAYAQQQEERTQQPDIIGELFNRGLVLQYKLTAEEMVNAADNSQIHTCENIVQLILEDRRRARREALSQRVQTLLKSQQNNK